MIGYVYFIRQKNEDLFKIGMTRSDPYARMKSIQTGIPHELELFNVIPTDNPSKLEKELHDIFKDYHLRGEWFNLTPHQVEKYIVSSGNPTSCDIVEIKQNTKKFYYQKSTNKIFMDYYSVKKIMGDLYLATCFASGKPMLGFNDGTLGIDYDLIIDDFGNKEEMKTHKEKLIKCAKDFNE